MTLHAIARSDFATVEWLRLSEIAYKYEPKMRLAYTRAMRAGIRIDKLQLRKVIIDCLSETCVSSAEAYNLVFNPNSKIYIDTVDSLTNRYSEVIDSKDAREAVKRILPRGLTLEDRILRSNTFGLDTKSALDIENYRQLGTGTRDLARIRSQAITQRGNLLATTETNRVVNTSLEALWIDNQTISKAGVDDITYYDNSIKNMGNIPKRARKIIITRRDDRVCNYCDPLDGVKARIGEEFDTEYGMFSAPPFHPNCRCFIIVSTQ